MSNPKTKKAEPDKLNLQTYTGSFISPERVVAQWGIGAGDKVADLGCGGGFFTLPLARLVGEKGRVYAADVMSVPLEAVKSKAYIEKLNNIIIIRADLEKKNSLADWIKDSECQLVFLANIICTAAKKKTILGEAKRILAPRGKLIVVEWSKNVADAFRNFGPPIEMRFSEKEVKSLVTKAGFKFEDNFETGEFHFGMEFKKK